MMTMRNLPQVAPKPKITDMEKPRFSPTPTVKPQKSTKKKVEEDTLPRTNSKFLS